MLADTPASAVQTTASINPLRVRNFRLLWIGESISILGDQFALIALPWLVLQLTNNNGLALGIVMALISTSRALFTLVGGALVDRFSPRAVLVASNLSRLILFALLTLLVLTDTIQFWMLFLFALGFGIADAFYYPGQTAILPHILDSEQLSFGNTLVQGMAQLGLFIGPVLAGIVIALFSGQPAVGSNTTPGMIGIGAALGIDTLTFCVSLTALWLIRVRNAPDTQASSTNMWVSIKEGIGYVWSRPTTRLLFTLAMAVNFLFVGPFWIGVPILANARLVEKAAAYGIIMSAFGAGSLIGMILAGLLRQPKPAYYGTLMLSIAAVLGIGLIVIPLTDSTAILSGAAALMGLAYGYILISFMTWLQKRVPTDLMGRVMSLLLLGALVVSPLSSALAGALVNISLTGLFVVAGALLVSLTLILALTPAVRRMDWS